MDSASISGHMDQLALPAARRLQGAPDLLQGQRELGLQQLVRDPTNRLGGGEPIQPGSATAPVRDSPVQFPDERLGYLERLGQLSATGAFSFQRRMNPLVLGDVSLNRRGAHNLPGAVSDGRDRKGDMDSLA